MKMQSFSSLMSSSGINLGDLSNGIDINKIANDNLGKISGMAKKVGINVDIPKVNIPETGITKTTNDSFSEVSKTYDESMGQVNDINNMNANSLLKESGIDMSGISFN